jgi:hypothetical protein
MSCPWFSRETREQEAEEYERLRILPLTLSLNQGNSMRQAFGQISHDSVNQASLERVKKPDLHG